MKGYSVYRAQVPPWLIDRIAGFDKLDGWILNERVRQEIADFLRIEGDNIVQKEGAILLSDTSPPQIVVRVRDGDYWIAAYLFEHWGHDLKIEWRGEIVNLWCLQCQTDCSVEKDSLSDRAHGSPWRGDPSVYK